MTPIIKHLPPTSLRNATARQVRHSSPVTRHSSLLTIAVECFAIAIGAAVLAVLYVVL